MIQRKKTFIALALIFILGFIFHNKYINDFPSHIHAWAESDRYALSLGFINNDLNFFQPETFVMNSPFPGDWKVAGKESITAVNFPIHDFITAIIMKVTGVKSPIIFRLYTLIYSFIGLFFLFKLSFLLTKDYCKSIFILIFAATSPVFVYYQGGFLPSIPSLANAIIGVFFYTKYLHKKVNRYFVLSLLFLMIATLSRTTFAVSLFTILGVEFIRILRKDVKLKHQVKPIILCTALILSYYFYNIFLRNKFGSLFLYHLLPVKNIQYLIEILTTTLSNWGDQYFSKFHYFIYSFLLILAAIIQIRKKNKSAKLIVEMRFLVSIIFLGYICFAFLMFRQFQNHDYYFLDTFYLPLVILLILVIKTIPNSDSKIKNAIYIISIIGVSAPMVLNAYNTQISRREYKNPKVIAYENSAKLLDSLSVGKNAKILIIDFYSPNIPFALMGRKGFTTMSYKKKDIENALNWDYDFVVMDNQIFLSNVYSEFPEIITKLNKVGTNGKISVYTLCEEGTDNTIFEFFGLKNNETNFETLMNYDTTNGNQWSNIQKTSEYYLSGNNSGFLSSNEEYGLTYKSKKIFNQCCKNKTLLFSSYFLKKQKELNNCEIVISINEEGENSYYKSFNLKELLNETNKWEKIDLIIQLPEIQSNDYEFSVYIWNRGKSNLFIDDFKLNLF